MILQQDEQPSGGVLSGCLYLAWRAPRNLQGVTFQRWILSRSSCSQIRERDRVHTEMRLEEVGQKDGTKVSLMGLGRKRTREIRLTSFWSCK